MTTEAKIKMAWIGIPVLLVIAYYFGFRKTMQQFNAYQEITAQKEVQSAVQAELDMLQQQKVYFSRILDSLNVKDGTPENQLMHNIVGFSKEYQVSLLSFSKGMDFTREDIPIRITPFTLEGDFNGILRTLYVLESEGKWGQLSSVRMEIPRAKSGKVKRLQAHVLLEQNR